MERRFDMSDFEQSLKDHADQFKMIPSKRVWNGIYNNLHPGSKWPSITIAILFLFSLITIGRFNNSSVHFKAPINNELGTSKNSINSQSKTQPEQSFAAQKNNQNAFSKVEESNINNNIVSNNIDPQSEISTERSSVSPLASSLTSEKLKTFTAINGKRQSKIVSLNNSKVELLSKNTSENKFALINIPGSLDENQIKEIPVLVSQENLENSFRAASIRQVELFKKDISIPASYQNLTFSPNELFNLTSLVPSNEESQIMGDLIFNQENSLKGRKNIKKKKNKTEWTFYVNPVISTVAKKRVQPISNNSSMVVLSSQQPSFKLLRNPRLGIEAGTEMSFKIDTKLKFITGFNLSYSGYNNLSNLVHPTYASLTLKDGNGGTYTKNYITHYGNGQSSGHVSLINYNMEASIPVGIQLNIWENEKIKIDFATLLEPTLMLKNDAYIISSDGRYYVNDPKLVRRTNLDGHFGSYITFKSKKLNWHIGPDFRYQLFSTYKDIYPAKEHLVDYGIRIGISK